MTQTDWPAVNAVSGNGSDDVWTVGWNNSIYHWDGKAWTSKLSGTSGELKSVWVNADGQAFAVGIDGLIWGSIFHWNGAEWALQVDHNDAALGQKGLFGVWGTGPNDVWAVGGGDLGMVTGAILHWNGDHWAKDTTLDPVPPLSGVWGTGTGNAWAVGGEGSGVILHWNGSAWTKALEGSTTLALFDLRAVWGTGAQDVWAVGNQNTAHWNGAEWKIETCLNPLTADLSAGKTLAACPPGLLGLWGNSANDVWAVGSVADGGAGYIAHWDGAAWKMVSGLMENGLTGIWGCGPANVWAVGSRVLAGGVYAHYGP